MLTLKLPSPGWGPKAGLLFFFVLMVQLSDALQYAWSLLRLHWMHPDFSEGPRAFGEKRPPRWNPDPNAREGGED